MNFDAFAWCRFIDSIAFYYQIERHGFPHEPTTLAFEPVQRLTAIGTKNGAIRLLGKPDIDLHLQHTPERSIMQLTFVINEWSLISILSDGYMHLWNFRLDSKPKIVHTLKFQRERITCCHLPLQSKWCYVGTEKGNVYVVNSESFTLSAYVINWNKAIELSRKTHPGAVVHLSDCPIDPSKLLIGFDSGSMILWDLRNRYADARLYNSDCLKSVAWHHEGKQLICSHNDGSLTTWNIHDTRKPVSMVYPHGKFF